MIDLPKKYMIVEAFNRIPFLVHGFGTRQGTEEDLISNPDLAGFHRVSLRQTHSDIVRVITTVPLKRMEGDAIVTDRSRILLIIKTADCLPVFIVDRKIRIVAAVHCGWRGTLKRIIAKTIRAMEMNYGSDSLSLYFAFGPCIDEACYEVGEDVREKFRNEGLEKGIFDRHPLKEKKYVLNLRRANRAQILAQGVPEKNIFSIDRCTRCDSDFFSYRRDGDRAGRMINFIGLC
ncbi:MAG: peptidoglycan editing factor PgeF [Candidatus Aminicenantes bacterium]